MAFKGRFSLAAILCVACAVLSSAWGAAIAAIDRFVGMAFAYLTRPFSITPAFAAAPRTMGPVHYHGRQSHDLRHEAGTSRRAADRHN
jgi:hypothetical protein